MRISAILGVVVWAMAYGGADAAPRVELEIVFEQGFPLTEIQEWNQMLSGVGAVRIRLRQERPGDSVTVRTLGSGAAKTYQVVGLLTRRQTLVVPGRKFGRGDRAAIAQWIDKLKDEGAEGVTAPRGAFGLMGKQLEEVHKALTGRITFSTKGQSSRTTLNRISRTLPLKVAVSPSALQAIPPQEPVLDELKGLSSGTAMAAVLRPFGLVMAPRRPRGGKLEIYVADSRELTEAWPVGWPPQKPPVQLMPDLFKMIDVEIRSIPLSQALAAVTGKIEAPYLLDQNSMARHGVDLEAKVSFPKGKTFYKKIIDRLLYQADLKMEIRLDEVDKPFLWITTLRR